MIVIDKDGVRLETVKGSASSALEKVAETVSRVATEKRAD